MKKNQVKKKSNKESKRKMLAYSVMCAIFIKEVRGMSDDNMLKWFTAMNKTNGFEDSFVLLLRDMIKKCLLEEWEKRHPSKEDK